MGFYAIDKTTGEKHLVEDEYDDQGHNIAMDALRNDYDIAYPLIHKQSGQESFALEKNFKHALDSGEFEIPQVAEAKQAKYEDTRKNLDPITNATQQQLQGITGGFSDELAGGWGAITNPLHPVRGYKEARDAVREQIHAGEEKYPRSSMENKIAGGLATAPLGNPEAAAGFLPAVKSGVELGGLYAAGNSEANNLSELTDDIAKGQLFGGATSGGMDIGARLVQGALNPNTYKEMANKAAAKAPGPYAAEAKDIQKLGKGNAFERSQGGMQRFGKDMLDEGIVTAGANLEDIAQRATEKADQYGKQIGSFLKEADQKIMANPMEYANKAVYAPKLFDTMESVINQEAGSDPIKLKALQTLKQEIAEWRAHYGNRPLTFEEAQSLKNSIRDEWSGFNSGKSGVQQNAGNKLYGTIKDEIENAGDRVLGESHGDIYRDAKKKYQTTLMASKMANKRLGRQELANRDYSLTDYISGSGAMGGAVAQGKDLIDAAAEGGIIGLANKVTRERGNPLKASIMNNLGNGAEYILNLLKTNPQALGKYRASFEDAARRGMDSVMMTHGILLRDPEYKKTLGLE